MPIRDYNCNNCGHIWEEIRKDQSDPKTCPNCLNEDFKRLPPKSNFQLKGEGWFRKSKG